MERRLNKNEKIILIVLFVLFVLYLLFISPALARYKNRSISSSSSALWRGYTATSYKSGSGTLEDPYIISNGEELAYLSSQLETNDYEGVYFKLSNHIRINEGKFKYNDSLEYIVDNHTYYVHDNFYYDNEEYEGDAIGSIKLFPPLNNFKGSLDGNSYIIYGFYSTSDESGLFTNLEGTINDLYISNAYIEGNDSGILSNHITNGIIKNIMVDGYIISTPYEGEEEVLNIINSGDYSVSGGISAYIDNTTVTNCVNKAEIKGSIISGGIIGYADNSTITNAYSNSTLTSYLSNGIGILKGNSSINSIYSSGEINGGLIGYIIDSTCTITNSFITTDNDLVVSVTNSTITSSNNYYTHFDRGNNITSTQVSTLSLSDKFFLTSYKEFVDFDNLKTNPENIWVYDGFAYPVLYIDDVVNPYVELYLGNDTWNSFSTILETKKYTDNILFVVNDVDDVHDYEKYYYVSNSNTALTKRDLRNVEWTPFTQYVQISEEGFYVVYVKVVNGNDVSYINSDLLILDKSEPSIDIAINNNHYSSLEEETVFYNDSFTATVTAEDNLSGIKNIEYYISDDFIDDYDVEWIPYQNAISFTDAGEYVLYVKVTDSCDYVSYASSPLIIYDGYQTTLHPLGNNTGNSITSNSSIVYRYTYSHNREFDLTHSLISSIVLPRYTNITLIDKVNDKVYGYTISNNDDYGYTDNSYATYPFTLFTEKGKSTTTSFQEGEISNEDWEVIIDFKNTNLNVGYNDIDIYLEGYVEEELKRPTFNHQTFSIDANRNVRLNHTISTSFNNTITYNSDSENEVLISSIVSYANSYDTDYSNKKLGLSIKLVDSSGRIMSREHLKNFVFSIGDMKYLPSLDNIIRINLNTNASINTTLKIITHQCSPKLRDGTYYIKINAYSSLDGLFYDSVIDNGIMIPVVVSKNVINSDYGFDVSMDNSSRIIDKNGIVNLSFNIKQSGLVNPNIKVSMYQKDELTAYNQDYTLIDLGFYSDIVADEYIDSIYYVSREPNEELTYSFNLDTALLDKTSYKFVFDLYDGSIKANSISKYIIIR